MATTQLIPVIVGVGDVKNRSQKIEAAVEPMQLMLQATLNALTDTNLSSSPEKELQSSSDTVYVVATWTWP